MKALFVPFAPSLAHVSRCLAVAEAWRDRGHVAIFAIGAERSALVHTAGFETRPVPEVAGAVFRTDRGLRWFSPTYFSDNLAAEQAILVEVDPDIVAFDFRFTTSLSARLAGRPAVSILHGNALRLALHPRETAQLLIGDPGLAHGIAVLRVLVLRQLFPIVFALIMRVVARRWAPLLKTYGRPPVNSPFELLLGDEMLVADLPDLLPPKLPAHTYIVGPLMWSGWEQPASWLDEFDNRPLVYVTMGSTVEAQAVLVKIIDALREGPYNVVVSTGNVTLPSGLELPPHIRAFPTVPGTVVMSRSVAVVHLGGHGTLMQALSAGVPSLILPVNPDQILVARQAQALDIGYCPWQMGSLPIDPRWQRALTPAEIRGAIDNVIRDQKYARACQTFRSKLSSYRGATSAAEILEGIARAATGNSAR